ncbi:MAG: hypothetical protein IJM99_10650 [Firmicutes bacterium]|nr:hypothetical protein [Bacillota bacterium]
MKSYVISVSVGTGCYRHIRISKTATLYKLHQMILQAFDFVDDHAHAFFMDNRCWSPFGAYFSMKMNGNERLTTKYKLSQLGLSKDKKFKYVFDFGEEWVFQCKVLRELDEATDIPGVIRSVGEAPEQYPLWEKDDDWGLDELPDIFPQEQIQELFDAIPLPRETVDEIHSYFDAAARLYGVIPVRELFDIYNSQNEPVSEKKFLMVSEIIRHEETEYEIIGMDDEKLDEEILPADRVVVDEYLVETIDSYYDLIISQEGKPYKILPKEEFLKYGDREYFPLIPQSVAMRQFLLNRKELKFPEDTWRGIMTMCEIDLSISGILKCIEIEGLKLESEEELMKFVGLLGELNNHTRKQVNRGYTPNELFLKFYRMR